VHGLATTAEEVMKLEDFNPGSTEEEWDAISNDVEQIQAARAVMKNAIEGPAARLALKPLMKP